MVTQNRVTLNSPVTWNLEPFIGGAEDTYEFSRSRSVVRHRRIYYDKDGKVTTAKIMREVPLQLFIEQFSREVNDKIPASQIPTMIPRNCRYMESTEDYQAFLIELPPQVFKIQYLRGIIDVWDGAPKDELGDDAADVLEAEISLPWQYFWVVWATVPKNEFNITHSLRSVNLLWATERIQDANSLVLVPFLPNIYENSLVCLGDTYPPSDLPVTQKTESIIADFYNTIFNYDLPIRFPMLGAFEKWEEMSKDDPYFWLKWVPTGELRKYIHLQNRNVPTKIDFRYLWDWFNSIVYSVRSIEEQNQADAAAAMRRAAETLREQELVPQQWRREQELAGAGAAAELNRFALAFDNNVVDEEPIDER